MVCSSDDDDAPTTRRRGGGRDGTRQLGRRRIARRGERRRRGRAAGRLRDGRRDGDTMDAGLQASVVEQTNETAVVRFADDRTRRSTTHSEIDAVRDGGVMLVVGEVPEPAPSLTSTSSGTNRSTSRACSSCRSTPRSPVRPSSRRRLVDPTTGDLDRDAASTSSMILGRIRRPPPDLVELHPVLDRARPTGPTCSRRGRPRTRRR